MQLLEGDEVKVKDCYKRVSQDRRHRQVSTQGTAIIKSRILPDWNMGLVETSENQKMMQDIFALLDLAHSTQTYSSSKPLETMLRLFAKNAVVL